MSQYDWVPAPGNTIYDPNFVEFVGYPRIKENWANVGGNWAFEGNPGDRSPNAVDGTEMGVVSYVPGKIELALRLDGNPANYIEFGNRFNFEYTNNFSLGIWFRVATIDSSARAFMGRRIVGGPLTDGWLFYLGANGKPGLMLVSNFPDNRIQREISLATPNFVDNQYHHVVATYLYPGSTPVTASAIRILVDGNEYNYADTIATLTGSIQNTATFQIGRNGNIANWKGDLDEAAVYTEALTTDQILCRYNSGLGRRRVFVFPEANISSNSGFSDPLRTAWTGFLAQPGPNHTGQLGYQLSPNGTDWYIWSEVGMSWVLNGATYNNESAVNDHIDSYPFDTIWVKVFLISDATGCAEAELLSVSIIYSLGQAPIVNIGQNFVVFDNESYPPFFDSTFSDPDSTVEHAYYKIPGLVDTYTEILQGGFETLQEAVQAFNFAWNTPGVWEVWLKVVDDEENYTEAFKYATVNKYTIDFNVTDSVTGGHIQNFLFDPGDGSGYHLVSSPFQWNYEYGSFNVVINTDIYPDKVVPIVVTEEGAVYIEMSKFLQEANIPDIVDAVWDEQRGDHQLAGSTGQGLSIPLGRILHDDEGADRVQKLYDETDTLALKFRLRFDGVTPVERIPIAI